MLLLFCVSLVMFWVLNYFDALSTYLIVRRQGTRCEKNPIARWCIVRFGEGRGITYLKSIVGLLTPLIVYAYMLSPSDLLIVLQIINAVYAYVVYHNLKVLNGNGQVAKSPFP